jgi:TPR repeat protein
MIRIHETIFLLLFFLRPSPAPMRLAASTKQAEAGDARAQYYLADTYFSSGDSKQAALWAEKAAKGGDVDAMALLSQIQFTQGDYAHAKALAQQAPLRAANAARSCWRACW